MGGFPLAASMIRPPENPLDAVAKTLSIKNMIGGEQLQEQQIQGATLENQIREQQLKDVNATTQAMQEWDGKKIDDLYPLIIKHGGSSNAVLGMKNQAAAYQEKMSTIAKNDAEAGEKNLDTVIKRHDLALGALQSATDPDVKDEDLVSTIRKAQNEQLVAGNLDKAGSDNIDKILASNDPKQIRGAMGLLEKGMMGAQEIQKNAIAERDAASKEWKEFAGLGAMVNIRTGEVKTLDGTMMTPAMIESKYLANQTKIGLGQKLSAEDSAFNKAYEHMKELVPMFNFNLSGGANPLSDAAIDQMADRFFQTGTLPPIGRGPAGQLLSRQIMQRASELHPGESFAAGSAEFKANEGSLKALQGNLDTVTAFENTALKNLQLFKQQAQKVIDTGIPLLNAPIRSAANLLGNQNQAAFNASLQVAVNEIAKVTSSPGLSGQLSDTARKEVSSFLPGSATVGQVMRLSDILTQDMANRHQSYQEQVNAIKARMGPSSNTGGGGGGKTITRAQLKAKAEANHVSEADAEASAKRQGISITEQ